MATQLGAQERKDLLTALGGLEADIVNQQHIQGGS
jgi:hypothetical protein